MHRILVVKMTSMGDVIHTLPAITDARAMLGDDVAIDWVVAEEYSEVPHWHPAVDKVIAVATRRWRRSINLKSLLELGSYIKDLREHRYVAIVDVQGLMKTALLGCACAQGTSHGYNRDSSREKFASVIYGHTYAVSMQQHAVMRSRQLFATVFNYDMPAGVPDYGVVLPAESKQRDAVILVSHAAKESKLWVVERWIEVGKELRAEGLQVELTWGNAVERERAEYIAKACGGTVVPQLTLAAMAIHIAGCKGVVSLDTGLAHMAAAFSVPNYCMCATTNPELSGALGRNQKAVADALSIQAPEVCAELRKLIRTAS